MDRELMDTIRRGDRDAFEQLFREWYPRLCHFASGFVGSTDISRDVVQEVFIRIWERREEIDIHYSIKAYLYRAVKNQALAHLRSTRDELDLDDIIDPTDPAEDHYWLDESRLSQDKNVSKLIWREVEALPEQRRTIFVLYRKHGLTYKEIAAVLGITRKTVENQMGRSLHFLRERLQST